MVLWSDVTQNIATVITTRPSHHSKGTHGMGISKTIQPPTVNMSNKKHQDKRSKIVILGDSHARGVSGELLHQLNHRLNTIGYVKPNARLIELLNTAKNVVSKLTKMDTIIMIGGSNDIDKNVHDRNLTSIVNFLDSTQNTDTIQEQDPMLTSK